MNSTSVLIVSILVVSIIAVLVYYLMRFLKGSIKLSLDNTGFSSGDTISGSFIVFAKKEIHGNKLTVSLIGTQITKEYVNGKPRTRSHEFYRDEIIVEQQKTYPVGYMQNYTFQIKAPDVSQSEFMNSPLGQALTTALRVISGRRTYIKWKIETRLNAKGVDLAANKAVSVNLGMQI